MNIIEVTELQQLCLSEVPEEHLGKQRTTMHSPPFHKSSAFGTGETIGAWNSGGPKQSKQHLTG